MTLVRRVFFNATASKSVTFSNLETILALAVGKIALATL